MSAARLLLIVLAVVAVGVAALLLTLWARRRSAVRGEEAAEATATQVASLTISATAPIPALEPSPEVGAGLHELAFGVTQRPPSGEPAHTKVAAAVDALLTMPVLKPEYAPRRPALLPRLIQAVNDAEVSRRELASLIAQDPALTGNLLRLANSAFYRVNSQAVESIDRAVALLGTQGLRSLIAAAMLQPVFKTSSGQFKRFPDVTWEHTQHTAAATEAYAAIVADADPFAGQLLALLFGLGTILVFRATLDEYARQRQLLADAATIARLIERHAPGVARRIAQDWEMTDRILTALDEQSPSQTWREARGLGAALRFGRYCGAIAVLRGEGMLDDDGGLAALRAGGYPGAACERIWARIAKQAVASAET